MNAPQHSQFSIQRWLEDLPDEEIQREMDELNEQIRALSNRHNALREALDLKQRFRQFYGGGTPTTTEISPAAENGAAVEMPFIPSVTKVHAPELRPSSISKSVLLLMESVPDKREWSVSDLSDALVERGWLDRGTAAQRSLGAALSRMTTDGEIRRVSRGRYAPTAPEPASPSLLDSEGGESG